MANVLQYVTCPHCGVNYQIAAPKDTATIYVEMEWSEHREEYFEDNFENPHNQQGTCPKCKNRLVYYFV